MEICSVCQGKADYLLGSRWYCRDCIQLTLGKPAPPTRPTPPPRVSLLNEDGHLVKLPYCSICHDRIAMAIIFGAAICRDCSRARRDFPDMPEEGEPISNKSQRPYLGHSIIDFPDEYVCVDVETTGRTPAEDEIIEVAALLVRNGVVCDTFVSLVRPSRSHTPWTLEEIHARGYDSYDDVPRAVFEDDSSRNMLPDEIVELTQITDDMLRDAPDADEVMPRFYEFVGDRILAGHNVIFDMNFLYDACLRCGLILSNNYVDTLRIARNLLPGMAHYDLASLARQLGVIQEEAHRAKADASVTAACLEAMRTLVLQTQTIPEYVKGFVEPVRRSRNRARKATIQRKELRKTDLVAPDDIDPSHPLFEKNIVFTGELSISRQESAQMAADAGAIVKTKVSRKTNFLVVGQQDMALVGVSGISGKEREAKEINASGKGHIQILSEPEFMELLQRKSEVNER